MRTIQKFSTHGKLFGAIRTAALTVTLSATSLAAHALDAVGYYSDNDSDRVFIVDPRSMSLVATIPTTGNQPYPIDKVVGDKVYVSTRNSPSLDIIDYDSSNFFNAGTIALQHRPRSVTYNANTKLALVSGVKKALMSVIDTTTDQVVGVVGDATELSPSDFGGSLATGHPFWVNDHQFLLTDRARRKVHLYKIVKLWDSSYWIHKQDTIATPTSVHHFEEIPGASTWWDKRTFYGMAEGAPADNLPPAVIEVFVLGNNLLLTRQADLAGPDVTIMGSHHLGMHPNGVHIYTGSAEGNTFVINRYSMSIINVVPSGANAGHTTFNAASNIAVTTNHRDTFMTLIDMSNHTKLGDVPGVSGSLPPAGRFSQSHTTSFDPQNPGVFYTAAAAEGNYVEVDAVSGIVTRTLPLDFGNGYTIQGTYNWNLGN